MRSKLPNFSTATAATAALIAGLLILFALHAKVYYFLCDDAFISFRYARNLIEGKGLVFNEGERVEGYTNFLWVLELAGLWRGFGIRPELASVLLSCACTAGTVSVFAAFARSLSGGARGRALLALALTLWVTNRTAAVWTTSGLETRQFTFFVLAGAYAVRNYRRGPRWLLAASLALALAEYTRPEALLLWAACLAWYALDALLARRLCRRDVAALTLPFAALVAAHFAFRVTYYGDWLPNTYYAKNVGAWPELGVPYVALGALEYGVYLVAPLALAGTAWRMRRGRDTTHLLAWLLVLPHTANLIYLGGDHFEFRPTDFHWPLLYLAAADGMLAAGGFVEKHSAAFAARRREGQADLAPERLARALGRATTAGLLAAALLYGATLGWAHHWATRRLATRDETFELHTPLTRHNAAWLRALPGMKWLFKRFNDRLRQCVTHGAGARQREHAVFGRERVALWQPYERFRDAGLLPRGAVQATAMVGIMPFYLPDLTVIDTVGLTDRTVARNKALRPNMGLAHARQPPPGYLQSRGVNVEVLPTAPGPAKAFDVAPYAVKLDETSWMPLRPGDRQWIERAFAGRLLQRTRLAARPPEANVFYAPGGFVRGYRSLGAFDDDTLDGWVASGDAEVQRPAHGSRSGQRQIATGHLGAGLLNSFGQAAKDEAQARYTSPRFTPAPGDTLTFLVGGGSDADVGVELHGPNGLVRRWAGDNREHLGLVLYSLAEQAGQPLWLEVVDRSTQNWGHVLADHFLLARPISDGDAVAPPPLAAGARPAEIARPPAIAKTARPAPRARGPPR